ncbi:MAG: CoA-binding protein [Anaeroplasmataceae bacterium]
MTLNEIMKNKNIVVIGNTLDEEKYAYKIKKALLEANYNVSSVGKELTSINEVIYDDFVIDLCIHPAKGLLLLKECKKNIKACVIQPGASSEEIKEYLEASNIPYVEDCMFKWLLNNR